MALGRGREITTYLGYFSMHNSIRIPTTKWWIYISSHWRFFSTDEITFTQIDRVNTSMPSIRFLSQASRANKSLKFIIHKLPWGYFSLYWKVEFCFWEYGKKEHRTRRAVNTRKTAHLNKGFVGCWRSCYMYAVLYLSVVSLQYLLLLSPAEMIG